MWRVEGSGWAAEAMDADGTRRLGIALAVGLRAGDLLILDGPLGAGKTTFTQGLGEGLRVRGPINSPTFVISRMHPSLSGGPNLIHVDAYRVSADELLDMDLEAWTGDAVTVVEWGVDRAEELSDSHLLVRIERPLGGADPGGARMLSVTPVGPGWEHLRDHLRDRLDEHPQG